LILVDTSVWIDYFNGADNEYTAALDSALDAGTVAIGDLIFLEILQGFRNDREFKRARTLLEMLDQYEMFGHEMVLKCAENYRDLTKKGITILTTTDVIIATFCIENQLPLLFSDRDFLPFVEKMGLRSVVEET
jgi:predicted nucleic acid-binding protein